MDKGRRNELAKLKQKKRIKQKNCSWMNESQIGQLKNHQIYGRCHCDYCIQHYNRSQMKKIDLDKELENE